MSRAERLVLGAFRDSEILLEISLGGLPPKGGGSEGERRTGSGPECVYKGVTRGVGGLREALEMLASRASVGCWEGVPTLVQL